MYQNGTHRIKSNQRNEGAKPRSAEPERIRNVGAFLRSYMKSSSGQRAITRQPTFTEVDNDQYKGRMHLRYNTLAHAMEAAVTR